MEKEEDFSRESRECSRMKKERIEGIGVHWRDSRAVISE
jgi:hypothetical protein